jgi:hypothetical protein
MNGPIPEQRVDQVTVLGVQLTVQVLIIVVLLVLAKSRRHRTTWTLPRATRIQRLCVLYLAVLYFADLVLGMSPGIGVLGYPFAIYFLALTIFRKRDLAARHA